MNIIRTAIVSRLSVRSHATVVACWIALAALPASRADDFTWNGGNGTWPSAGWTNVTTSASPVAGPTGASNTNSATISAGTVTFAGNDTFGNDSTTATPVITLNTGGTLNSGGFFNTIWNLNLAGGTLLSDGGANASFPAWQLAGTVSVTGTQASTLGVAASPRNANNAIKLGGNGNATLTLNVLDVTNSSATDLFVNTVLQAGGGLTKAGAGTAVLSAANTYTGSTRIAAGTLNLNNASAILASTLDMNAADSGSVTFATNATLGGLTGSRNLDMGTRTLGIGNNGQNTTYSGVISNGSLTKVGSGTLTLSGSNTYTGGTQINGGVLAWLSPAAQPTTGTTTVANGAGLSLGVGSGLFSVADFESLHANTLPNVSLGATSLAGVDTTAGDVSIVTALGGTRGVIKTGSGTLTLSGASTYSGGTTVSAGTLTVSGGSNRLSTTGAITVANGATLDLAGGSQATSGTVTLTGGTLAGGTLTMTSGNNYSPNGTITLAAGGTFRFDSAGQRLLLQNRTLTMDGSAGGAMRFGGDAANSANYVGVDSQNGTLTLNGGTLAFVIANGQTNAGGGWLRIGANNGATGTATVNSGLLDIGHSASLGSRFDNGGVAATSSGTLTIAGGQVVVGSGTLATTAGGVNGYLYLKNDVAGSSGSAIVNLTGGTLTAKRIVPGTGGGTKALNLSGGTLRAGGSDASFLTAATGFTASIGNGGGTIDTNGFDIAIAAPLAAGGAGGLSKLGTGSLTLSAANSFTGNTAVSAGTLALGAAGTFAASPVVSLAPGARLDLTSKTSGFSFGASQTLAGSGLVSLGAGRDLTISGSLAPGQSPGTLSLDGNLVLDATSTSVFEIDGVTSGLYDVVQQSGGSRTATFGGTLSLAFASGWSTETTLKLFDFATYSGVFSQVQTTGLGAGYSASFNELTGNVVVVPEPGLAAAAIAALAAGIGLAARRRRKPA